MKPYKLAGFIIDCVALLGLAVVLAVSPASADVPDPGQGTVVPFASDTVSSDSVPVEVSSIEDDNSVSALPVLCRLGYAGATVPLGGYPPGLVESMRGGW